MEELEDAKQCLGEMNASEDNYNDELDVENPQHLSAAICRHVYSKIEGNSDGEEAFDFAEVDAMDSSDAEMPAKEKIVSDIRNLT